MTTEVAWVKRTLRNSVYAPRRVQVVSVHVIGSEARGMARPGSDLDIAVIIPPVRGKTSLRYTEEYHMKFPSDVAKPELNGRRIDFQFFYLGELPADYVRKPLRL